MGQQIIKQPNGRYCLFSSIVDNVTYYNMTEKDIIDLWVKEESIDISKRVKEKIKQLDNNEKPYYQFTKTFKEMISWVKEVHGKKEANKINDLIVKP